MFSCFCFCVFLLLVLFCFESSRWISFCFASCFLVVVVVVCCCSSCFAILLLFDFWKPVKNISEKMEIGKTAKMKNAEKTDILTRAVSTVVFTNSVLFPSFVFLSNFAFFAENTIKIGVSAPPQKTKKLTNFIS